MTESDELHQLDAAVRNARTRLREEPSSPEDKSLATFHLVSLLYRRFGATGDLRDLDEVVTKLDNIVMSSMQREERTTPDPSSVAAVLAAALHSRFQETRQLADLERANLLAERAVELEPPGYKRSMYLSNLAAARYQRFQLSGTVEDLQSAIAALEGAIESGFLEEAEQATCLNNLSIAMRTRYALTGLRMDLDTAISAARNAIDLTRPAEPEWSSRLVALGSALMEAGRTEDQADLVNEAVLLFQRAVALDASHNSRDRVEHLTLLGYALSLRFKLNRSKDDLDEAITMLRRSLSATLDQDPAIEERTILLSTCLERRFEVDGDDADISEAIDLARRVITRGGSTTRRQHTPSLILNLGMLLAKRSQLQTARPNDTSESFLAISSIINDSSIEPSARIAAARVAGQFAADRADWTAALGLYKSMLDALGNGYFTSRQPGIADLTVELAADGAACAVAAGDIRDALALFEASRSTVLTAERERRDTVRRLRWVAPAIAHRVSRIAISPEGIPPGWDELVEEVRQLEAFEGFMRLIPPRLNLDLHSGEVAVAVNISQHGCFALIVHGSGIRLRHLPDLSVKSCASRVELYTRHVLQDHLSGDSPSDRQRLAERTLSETLAWLADTIARPVAEEIARFTNVDAANGDQRIFWCLGSPISILPMHAVGTYLEIQGAPEIGLAGNPSYIPNLRFLDRKDPYGEPSPGGEESPLVVLAGTALGAAELGASNMEISAIRRVFPNLHLLRGAHAEVEDVLRLLPKHTLLHFSGHGSWNPSDSLESGLLLHNGYLNTERLLQLDAGRTRLAVLSASCTALASVRRPGTFIHPAAALLMAGIDDVVGTVLSVRDRNAGEFVSEFYRILGVKRRLDGGSISQAVNDAARRLAHKYPDTPTAWVPFAHLGR